MTQTLDLYARIHSVFDYWGKILFISLVAVSSFWISNAQADIGFYPPETVFQKEVYGAIYKLQAGVYFSQEIESESHYQELLDQFENHPTLPKDLKKCFENKISPCLLNLGYGVNGSAVALNENGDQVLWTNLHLVRSFVKEWVISSKITSAEVLKRAIKKVNIPLILKNSRGEVVFNSTTPPVSDQAYFEAVPATLFLPEAGASPLGVPDAVKIRLTKRLPHSLQLGEEAPVGASVFLIGFPKPTDSRETSGPDSNGVDQYLTRGNVMSAAQLVADYELDALTLRLALNEDYKYVLDTDCEQGMSGGALLNGDGHFIGLFQGIFSPRDLGPLACIALTPSSLRFLESISR